MRVVFANTIRWIDGSRLGICDHALAWWQSGFAIALSDFAVYGKDTAARMYGRILHCLARPGDRSLGSCKSFSFPLYRLVDELQSLYR